MKVLLKLYSISCIVVVAFFVFFTLPLGSLPFSDAVNLMFIGGVLAGGAGLYTFYFYRREGLDFGWFLLFRGGFWVIAVACVGMAALLCGLLLSIWPELFTSALEQGALPFGIVLVSLFWLALIFLVGYPAFGMTAKAAGCVRVFRFRESLTYALIAIVCAALATIFFSLFLEMLNDIFIRISVSARWKAIWIFLGLLISLGMVYGIWKGPEFDRETDTNATSEKK